MFGFYRTFLAIMVVVLHIGAIPWVGGYAVYGFYILSGYLMTLIMQRTYGYSPHGVGKYLLNRFLRIYPLYWVAALSTLTLIYSFGESYTSDFIKYMVYPTAFSDIIKNLILLFPTIDTTRLVPPAWALTVELCFYILIALGLSKHAKFTIIWLVLSVIYHVVAWFSGWDRYFSIFAASLPFALGSALYFYRDALLMRLFKRKQDLHPYLPLLIVLLMVINWYIGFLLTRSHELFFYTNVVLCALMLVILSSYKSLPFMSKKADAYWGDFSYPIYLIHYQVALVVMYGMQQFGVDISRPSTLLLLVTIPCVFLAAWLLMMLVERPIERLRTRVKEKL